MSDFLVRLARRAAGLAPIAIPRPADIPTEILMPVQGAADGPAAWPEVMAETPGDGPSGLPAAPPPASEAPGELSTATAYTPPVAVPAPLLRTESPRPAPPEVAARAASPVGSDAPSSPEPVAVVTLTPEPPTLVQMKHRVAPAVGPVVAALIPRASDRGAEAVHVGPGFQAPPETPLPGVAAGPAPVPLAWPTEERAEAGEPSIQVHIGRIELVSPPSSPPVSSAPRRAPRGFTEQRLARRYLDRRWY